MNLNDFVNNPNIDGETKEKSHFKSKEDFFSQYQLLKDVSEDETEIFDEYGFYPAQSLLNKGIIIITYHNDIVFSLVKEKNKVPLKIFNKYSQNRENIFNLPNGLYFEISEDFSIIDKEYNEDEARAFYKDLLTDASRKHASDIHLTWTTDKVTIRYRLDGTLVEQPKTIDLAMAEAIKNIFVNKSGESEYEQNEVAGQFVEYVDNIKTEYRVSIGPTVQGYVIVLRIEHSIDKDSNLEDLGYTPEAIALIRHLFSLKHGLILVTGQTGSGKSTLMYTSAVERLYKDPIRIPQFLTIEDPVEIVVDGMNQIQVNTKGEKENWITYTSAIKMFLRQNPDVIIVGEIRDAEVAIEAVKAAKTGHLTLSTLHTNDVKATFPRLRELDIENANIEDAVRGVVSQKLINKLCNNCKEEHIFNGEKIYKRSETGCPECAGSTAVGTKGRVPVVEIAELGNSLNNFLPENYITYYSLEENIHYLLKEGIIDLAEANKVIKIKSNDNLKRRNFIIEKWAKATQEKNDEHIFPVYQSIVDRNGYLVGYESFMRLRDEHGELVYPKSFMNLIKEMEMYYKFSLFTLDSMIEFAKTNEKKIFWNLEVDNITESDFLDLIYEKLKESNMLNKFVLEIPYKNDPLYNTFIKQCNEKGIEISLDHFEGNSSDLRAIERNGFKIAYIKTNKELIDGLSSKEEWTEEYISICKKVKSSIIMNFIETNSMYEEYNKRFKTQVFGFQGYGIQTPSTFEEIKNRK